MFPPRNILMPFLFAFACSFLNDAPVLTIALYRYQAVPRFQFCFSICKGNLFFQFLAHRIAF